MIRHELTTSLVRFYKQPSDDPYQPYDAICTLVWENSETVWIHGFHGSLDRKLLRELAQFLIDNKIKIVKAHRAFERTLPFVSKREGDVVEIDVQRVAQKLSN